MWMKIGLLIHCRLVIDMALEVIYSYAHDNKLIYQWRQGQNKYAWDFQNVEFELELEPENVYLTKYMEQRKMHTVI